MATDYDAPRKTDDDDAEDSIEELKSRRVDKSDEFTCSRCFLVHHRSQLAKEVKGQPVCRECAA